MVPCSSIETAKPTQNCVLSLVLKYLYIIFQDCFSLNARLLLFSQRTAAEPPALKEAAISSATLLSAIQKSPELLSIIESYLLLTLLLESFC